ncbi:hypothetical protein HYU15_00745 [Candidatus Woesearchaeota archaeon]|nr:hypothetical protein [Candidatus Woesearchaeota archaeon]
MQLFRAKVRKVGTSFGVLIPKGIANRQRISEGEEIEIGLLKKRNIREVMKLVGSAKGAEDFKRDRTERY